MSKCSQCGYESNKKNRSGNQNRYYWSVVIELISEHTGFTREEIHEILKHKFLRRTIWIPHNADGVKEMNVIARSTTDLTTKEFEEFLSSIRGWAAICLGISIPEPNEQLMEA